ncbi:MAG: restriction endonuclease subunit S [Methylobacter sp.]|jgi:type I restriction enzyme S subunit
MNLIPFGSVCELQNGRAFKPSEWEDVGTPIVRIQNLNDETKPFNYCNFEVEGRFHIQSGDLLFSWSGTPGTSFGAFFWNRGKAFLNQHIFRVDIDEKIVDKNYLCHAINSKLTHIIDQAHGGVGLKHITKGKLEAVEIYLPTLPEQKRIAAILDKADSLRRKNQQAIQLADQFLRAVFLDMFGDPVNNPKGWDKTPLSELIKVSSGNGLIASQMDINGKFPVYGGNGINGHHSEYMFEEPQLVIGRVGVYCGVIHITESKAWITDNALYVKEYKQEIDMHFLAESLKQANLNQYAGRAAQPLVSGSRIYPLKVLVPPLDNQKEFSKLKKDFLGLTEKFDNSKLFSEYLFNSLSQKAFAGEL